jgi:hypothetical protein
MTPPGSQIADGTPAIRDFTGLLRALKDYVDQGGSGAPLASLAASPDALIASLTTFDDTTGVPTAGTVRWPDGAGGTYTATPDAFGVASYVVTHVLGGVTTTFTQPTLTRDSSGRVTSRPAITVS